MEPQLDIHEALKALAHPGRLDFLKWLKHPEHYFGLASADVQGGEVADKINKLDKHICESLQQSLDTINKNAAERVRSQIFLFDDILLMPQHSRALLLNDIASDTLTMALRAASPALKECVLNSISPRARRVVEAELRTGVFGVKPRDIALARRSIARQAISMATSGQLPLMERGEGSAAA